MNLPIVFFSKFLIAIFTRVLFDFFVDLLHMFIAIANLSETLATFERTGERAFFAVRPNVVVELAEAGDESIARDATLVESIVT